MFHTFFVDLASGRLFNYISHYNYDIIRFYRNGNEGSLILLVIFFFVISYSIYKNYIFMFWLVNLVLIEKLPLEIIFFYLHDFNIIQSISHC